MGQLWPDAGLGALSVAVHAWDLLREAQMVKCLLAYRRPSFPLSQSLHQEAPISLLSFSIKGQTENHNHRKLTNLITWTTALANSMKL